MTTKKIWSRACAIATVFAAAVALSSCSAINQITNGISDAADPGSGTTEDIFSLEVGDCETSSQAEGEVSDTKTIDCSEPHATEVYASVNVPDGDFPGPAVIEEQAISDCTSEFESFVGVGYDDSMYSFSWYYPTENTWADGDREILCAIVDPSGAELTGSLAGVAK